MIPTAEEFFRKFKHTHSPVNHHLALIEFAKLHVEQALKEVSEKAKLTSEVCEVLQEHWFEEYIDKDSILTAYPLKNIK
jgi:hypothetical protein